MDGRGPGPSYEEEEDDWDMSDNSIALGEGASARGGSTPDDASELDTYVPERRPSLDLGEGPGPVDTSHWHVERAHSPVPSYTSMESEGVHRSDKLEEEAESSTRVHLERTDSYSSCYSLDSDDCETKTKKVKKAASTSGPEPPARPELIKNPNEERHPALTVDFTFRAITRTLEKLVEEHLRYFKFTLWKRYPETFSSPPQALDMVDLVDRLLECYDLEVALQLTKALLQDMGQNKLVEYLQKLCVRNEVRFDLKLLLKKKYSSACEGLANQGEQRPFDGVYTEPYITVGLNHGPNIEHEVRKIKKLNTKRKPERRVTTRDVLTPTMIEEGYTTSMLTTGVAGSGKSMAVHKFILDWAEGRAHQHVSFLFPLPFRELNHLQDRKLSLFAIVQYLYPVAKKLPGFACDEGRVMFVCDGLDEYNRTIEYHRTESLYDAEEPAKLHVIVANLVKNNMLRNSLTWVTSRPRPACLIPNESVHGVTEVRGFTDAQKEAYFRQRFEEEDPALADRVVAHLLACRTLHVMCHLPLFCWVVCGEFRRAVEERGPRAELPAGIAQMFTQLLLVLMRVREGKVGLTGGLQEKTDYSETDLVMKLGKLAFAMLEKGQTLIPEEFWEDGEVSTDEAVARSGLCTEFTVEQFVLYKERVYAFLHPTVQDYLAALYVFLSYKNLGKNVLEPQQPLRSKFSRMFKDRSLELYRSAVELALGSPDGNFDVFLRFLLGMALPANQELLRRFFVSGKSGGCSSSGVAKDAASLLRRKIKEKSHPERNACLELCLEELGQGGKTSRSNSLKLGLGRAPSRSNSLSLGRATSRSNSLSLGRATSRSNSMDLGTRVAPSRSHSVSETTD